MSLALAEIVFKHGGLDVARAEHRHHGLLFKHRPGATEFGKSMLELTTELAAVPMEADGVRMGTFELWHRGCREMPLAGVMTQHLPNGNSSSGFRALLTPSEARLPPVPLKGLTLFDCLIALPGMMDFLVMNRIQPRTLRAKLTADVYMDGQPDVTTLTVHPTSLTDEFFENVLVHPDFATMQKVDLVQLPSGGIFKMTHTSNEPLKFEIPDGVPWSRDEIRLWTKRQPLNEFGYLYFALFITGNYARYFPDLWHRDVEACNSLALAIERLLNVAEERMALLTLGELSRECFVPD